MVLYYAYGLSGVISGIMVITAPNAGYSVFWLIMVFGSVVGLFTLLEVAYIGLIFVIVYVGAIAVFFIFVIMMLKKGAYIAGGDKLVGMVFGVVFFFETVILGGAERDLKWENMGDSGWGGIERVSSVEGLEIVYTDYKKTLILAGCVLLVGMLGAIVLTEGGKQQIKRQAGFIQINRELWG